MPVADYIPQANFFIMKQLNDNWLTEGWVDFEYKKYLLLAYLKHVSGAFQKVELYPELGDLVRHYRNLTGILEKKETLSGNFPEKLEGVDADSFTLQFRKIIEDDEVMEAIAEIVDFALPRMRERLNEGKEIYDFVEKQCELAPIGVMPLYAQEGYFFVSGHHRNDVQIHRYQITVFEHFQEQLRAIHSTCIKTIQRGLGETYEAIKTRLARNHKDLPNPATFLIQTRMAFPDEPTLIPVARRMLVQYVTHRS